MSQVSEQNDEIDLKELFAAIWHNWWIVLSSAVIFAVLAGYYAFAVATPLYKASTRFELLDEDAGGSLLGSASGLAALAGISVQGSSSEAEALEDRILSRPFVETIYDEAAFREDPVFNASLQPQGLIEQVKEFLFGKPEAYELTRNDYLVMAVGALTDSLEIIPGDNGIIELTFVHPDSNRAAEIANIIVKQSLLDIFERERKATRDSLNYFAEQLLGVKAELDAASAAVRDYAIGNNLQSQQELARTSSQLSQLRREIEVLDKGIVALNKIGDNDFDGSTFARENPVAGSLAFRRLLNLPRDPVDWIQPSADEIKRATARLESQRETLTVSFNAIEARAKSSGAEAVELAALEREVEVQKAIYESVITQFEARSLTSGYERASGRLVESAIPPSSPWQPNKKLFLAIGVFLGGFAGIAIALIKSISRGYMFSPHTFRSSFPRADMRKLNTSELGKIDLSNLDSKQLSATNDILVSTGEDAPTIAVLPTLSNNTAARVVLSLSKATARIGIKTALLDLSNGSLQKLIEKTESEVIDHFAKHSVASEYDLLTPLRDTSFLRKSEAKSHIGSLNMTYQRIFVLLPSLNGDTAITRTVLQAVDTAVITAESAKTKRSTADAIERILDKSQISEPLLVVT